MVNEMRTVNPEPKLDKLKKLAKELTFTETGITHTKTAIKRAENELKNIANRNWWKFTLDLLKFQALKVVRSKREWEANLEQHKKSLIEFKERYYILKKKIVNDSSFFK